MCVWNQQKWQDSVEHGFTQGHIMHLQSFCERINHKIYFTLIINWLTKKIKNNAEFRIMVLCSEVHGKETKRAESSFCKSFTILKADLLQSVWPTSVGMTINYGVTVVKIMQWWHLRLTHIQHIFANFTSQPVRSLSK